MAALSPRNPAPKLRSTVKEKYGTPRRAQSVFQTVALARGYTVKAGVIRRQRLKTIELENNNGVPTTDSDTNHQD